MGTFASTWRTWRTRLPPAVRRAAYETLYLGTLQAARNGARLGRRLASEWCEAAVDLAFPPHCLLCGRVESTESAISSCGADGFCDECRSQFGYGGVACCEACAAPLPRVGNGTGHCLYCLERKYRFDATQALGIYRGALREAVLRMKMPHQDALTLAGGRLLAERVHERFADSPPDLVAPLPMHWWKRLWRGTNAPDLLAEALGRKLNLPVVPRLLKMRRRTRKQGTLLPGERMKNVRGAFRVATSYAIAEKHVLLVDDVMTTGATASEAAKTLRRAGAARVSVAVVARGVGLRDQNS